MMTDTIIKNVAALSHDQLVEIVSELCRNNGATADLYGRFLDELRSIDFDDFASCAARYEQERQQLNDDLVDRLKAIAVQSASIRH